VFVGLDADDAVPTTLDAGLQKCTANDLDFLCLPLHGPAFEPFVASTKLLTTSEWHHAVVGKVSPVLPLLADDPLPQRGAETLLLQEIAYCAHLSLPAVLLPSISTPSFVSYARAVYSGLLQHPYPMMWLRVPLILPEESSEGAAEEGDGAWRRWSAFRTLCNHHPKLVPALELTADLPSPKILERWQAEQVKCLIIPTSTFMCGLHNRPTLSLAHQRFVKQCLKFRAQLVLTGPVSSEVSGYKAYREHLTAIRQSMPKPSAIEEYEQPFHDVLQAPLQPLMDHLEASTYEVFERDPVKYQLYEKAITLALKDLQSSDPVVVMVVGAGRGPLVNAALRAAKQAKVAIRVYAVEKNPNAVVTLRALQTQCDWAPVTIVAADMRRWAPPEGCDILVSELLGSFGDNELSPECLDGAQRFLKPTGISIPCRSVSYLAPLMAVKLWNDVTAYKDLEHFETSYVVRIRAGMTLDEPQEVFSFVHPNPDCPVAFGVPEHDDTSPPDNTRVRTLRFKAACNALVHGFAGYFEAQLYKTVLLSIRPKTHSLNMFSWFPIMFPVKTPFPVTQGEVIEVTFWRRTGNQKVWYEWAVSAPVTSPIHNPNGRSCAIGL